MGRWTPLILMAGGLAILLGTVIGTLFPMGAQQNAKAPQTGTEKVSGVLPANINVNNSTASNSTTTTQTSRVAQGGTTTNGGNTSDTSTDSNTNIDQSSQAAPASGSNNNGGNAPIRALW
ncbi:hypothetical protein [Calothrix sp. PCC 6303]|uniref:hypothetical protein n=1 Tax=Calothrix sp. PCC 6303 TaxID=1170562 RepID=UPI0002A01B46|nr:hypothetical protein [Calothrix sp. PCC 6303]AFY99283.1 hypothetical protein Cal6303_0176 [Calothrix sp. PCC 6303]